MKSAKLGQHFLTDDRVLENLVEQVPPEIKEVLEIGVGDGRLTEKLLQAGFKVIGYELDSRLYSMARERMMGNPKLRLVLGDGFSDDERYDAVVSSLPYYASRRFVEWFAASSTPLGLVVLQKDFADKISSKPGSRKYGTYSVLAWYCFRMKELFVIPPMAFEPRPKVYSSVLKLERLRTLPSAGLMALKLKSLFSYRGRRVRSFVRDSKRRQLWGGLTELDEGLLVKRVEDLSPQEALNVIRGMASG
jgi:16S rRNA (adenine1518-N6/adenine1519-N6)-dimethyltransferase